MKNFQEYFKNLIKTMLNWQEQKKVGVSCITLISIIIMCINANIFPEKATLIIVGVLIVLLLMNRINSIDFIIYSLILPSELYNFIGIGIGLLDIWVKVLKKDIKIKHLIKDIQKDKSLQILLSTIGISTIISMISTRVIFNGIASTVYFLIMLSIFKLIKFNKYTFKDLDLTMNNIFIIQAIVFIPLIIMDVNISGRITSGDLYKGTFSNAHMLCLWLIWYSIVKFIKHKDSVHKLNKTFTAFKLVVLSIMIYLTDGKHLWLAAILSLIMYSIISKFKSLKKISVIIVGTIIVLSLFTVTNISKLDKFKQVIANKSSYISMYMYKKPFNTKFEYIDSTLNDKLKGYHLLIGYGQGQYGSRVANLRAYEYMSKSEGLATQLSKVLSPYVLEEYKDQASKYDDKFVKFIPNMSAVLAYPFSSMIAIIAEVGILGFIAYLMFFNSIANRTKVKEAHLIIILLLFLMIFDSYFEMTSGIGMFWIIMGTLSVPVIIDNQDEKKQKKKKILIAQYSLGGGGAEKVLIDVLNNVDYSKYEINIFLLRKEGVYLNKVNRNVNIISPIANVGFKNEKANKVLNDFRFSLVKFFPKIVHRVAVGNEYDVEIAFVEGLTSKFIADSCNKNSKKISWVHIDLEKYKPIKEFFQKRFYPKFDIIACVSEDSKRVFEKLYPNLKGKTRVVYNLIDSKQIIELANEKVEFNKEIPTIIAIGRLSIQKRFDVLIKAHKLLIDDGINHKLLILGEGEKRDELQLLINKLNVNKTVDLHGFVDNPYKYIKKAKVFAMSSDFEGLPLVVCESLVLGKPIVATRCTGPTELLGNGEYGVLVDCDDEMQLKDALKSVLTDDSLCEYYSNKSLERSKIFDTKEAINNIYNLIELEG
jgi:glycosyltransferase involved in cell wall biosynthesis